MFRIIQFEDYLIVAHPEAKPIRIVCQDGELKVEVINVTS